MQSEHEFRRTERIDNFVDAAFAFATTLLVISVGDPPTSLDELRQALLRTPAFAAGFALIALFWWQHHSYAALRPRRDGLSLLLSLAIVFVILVYVFPLRLLMESGLAFMSGGLLPGRDLVRSGEDLRLLYGVYATGFIALGALYAALYRHAGVVLARDGEAERADRAFTVAGSCLILAAAGLLSALLAALLPFDGRGGLVSAGPGLAYTLIGPAMTAYYWWWTPALKRRSAAVPVVSTAAEPTGPAPAL